MYCTVHKQQNNNTSFPVPSSFLVVDRIHRIGQTRPVTIHRFVMKDSVEERMVELQVAKSLQAKGAMQKLKAEEQKQTRLRNLKGLLKIE